MYYWNEDFSIDGQESARIQGHALIAVVQGAVLVLSHAVELLALVCNERAVHVKIVPGFRSRREFDRIECADSRLLQQNSAIAHTADCNPAIVRHFGMNIAIARAVEMWTVFCSERRARERDERIEVVRQHSS